MASNFHSCLAESRGSFLFGMFPSSMYYIGHFTPQCPLGYPGEESGCSTKASSLVLISCGIQEGMCGVCPDTDPHQGLNWGICAPFSS